MSGHELLLQHDNWGNIWFMGVVNESAAAFNLVTPERSAAENNFINAQADVAAERPAIGIITETVSAEWAKIVLFGFVYNSAWTWTPGDTLYLSDTEGQITNAAGTVRQEVGIALSANLILFAPKSIDLDT